MAPEVSDVALSLVEKWTKLAASFSFVFNTLTGFICQLVVLHLVPVWTILFKTRKIPQLIWKALNDVWANFWWFHFSVQIPVNKILSSQKWILTSPSDRSQKVDDEKWNLSPFPNHSRQCQIFILVYGIDCLQNLYHKNGIKILKEICIFIIKTGKI